MPRTLLRLPFGLGHGLTLRRLTSEHDLAYRDFALSGPERVFVRALLERRRLWTWRSDQKAGLGDFVVVDMSEPRPARRVTRVLELKSRRGFREGRRGLQMRNAERARAELGWLVGDDVRVARGSGPELLAWL